MMKKAFLIVLSALFALTMSAGNVTPEEALQQATRFMTSRSAHGHGPMLSPGASPQLSLASKVSSLYVFNVASGNGFVIVSSDDRTTPILGYADSGSFDPEDIPSNMQAWLQGYADEIGRLSDRAAAPAAAPSHAQSVKTSIAPLIQTKWDQISPYNNLCPTYDGSHKSATGCVATAMAQVMYYTETKAGNATTTTTAEIPSYSSQGTRPAVPAGTTINWKDMQLSYPSTGTDAEKAAADQAVAEIMYWCGLAAKMSYGYESYSNTNKAASALTSYFGYHSETTKVVIRSLYTYEGWMDLLYHELKNGRPVVYGGQSSGGGHEFICDGYDTEDYFHINWGWSGKSDGYFKLSLLDPDQQGVGGSSSTEGYQFGQDAIIGIQKADDTGTVLDITPFNTNDLVINGISLENNTITSDETAIFNVSVTNNGSADYSGDIWVGSSNLQRSAGKTFFIPAGETKTCQIEYKPNWTGSVTFYVWLPIASGGYMRYDTHTVLLKVTAGSTGGGSDDVELILTVNAENTEATGNTVSFSSGDVPEYYLYGNEYRATITLTNNTSKNYVGQFYWGLAPDYESYYYSYQSTSVPAGTSKTFTVSESNLDMSKGYTIMACYRQNGSANLKEIQYYTLRPAVFTYAADGTKSVTAGNSTFGVPENVLAVDMRGAGVTSVLKNSEPNCLYVLKTSDAIPEGLTNVVTTSDDTNFTADALTLVDGSAFYSPVEFTAGKVEFTYNNSRSADGTNGWNTIVLPFDVTKVTANGDNIDWFHSSTDEGKNFWVKAFTSDEPSAVNFDFADEMKANTPYIVALPGNKWGAKWDMSDKTIKFIGENTKVSKGDARAIVTGANYRFIGSTLDVSTSNIYRLNDEGNQFILSTGSQPFRAYFKAGSYESLPASLSIGAEDGEATAIIDIDNCPTGNDEYYNLNGQRVELPVKGIYIHHGKKIIKK